MNLRARYVIALAGTGLMISASGAGAATVAISPNVTTGTQNFDNVFGIDFNAVSAAQITQLGVFDNGSDGILLTDSPTQPIIIQVWNRDTGIALASASFGGGSPTGTDTTVGSGKVFFQPLAVPLTLTAGGHYYVSEDFGGAEKFGNVGNTGYVAPTTNDGGGLITFVGKGRSLQRPQHHVQRQRRHHGRRTGRPSRRPPPTGSSTPDPPPATRGRTSSSTSCPSPRASGSSVWPAWACSPGAAERQNEQREREA